VTKLVAKKGRKFLEFSITSESPNKKRSKSKTYLPPQESAKEVETSSLKLTSENLAAIQSLYGMHDPMSKLRMQAQENNFFKEVASVKSLAFDNTPYGKNFGGPNYDSKKLAQSMMWDISNSALLKQSMISAHNSNAKEIFELQKVPVLTYCFEKYKNTRRVF